MEQERREGRGTPKKNKTINDEWHFFGMRVGMNGEMNEMNELIRSLINCVYSIKQKHAHFFC